MIIYCCGCRCNVNARLTDGAEIYPHRNDLAALPFWRCDTCKNFVGCHHKTKNRTAPLGVIATPAIKNARQHIHKILDPIWQNGHAKRGKVYAMVSKKIGVSFHTANIKSIADARIVYAAVQDVGKEIFGVTKPL